MSTYGLKKIQSKIFRADTVHDLALVNKWRTDHKMNAVSPIKPSVRQLENCVALGLEGLELDHDFPALLRGSSFYLSILPEINDKERKTFEKINKK